MSKRSMISHDAREFTGKKVLFIGTSYSAEDIASQCYKYGAEHLYLSWRTAPMGFEWPEDKFTTLGGLLEKIENNAATGKHSGIYYI